MASVKAGQFFLVENISSPILPCPLLSSPPRPYPLQQECQATRSSRIRSSRNTVQQEYRPAGSSRNTVRQDYIRQEYRPIRQDYHPIQQELIQQELIQQELIQQELIQQEPAGSRRIAQNPARPKTLPYPPGACQTPCPLGFGQIRARIRSESKPSEPESTPSYGRNTASYRGPGWYSEDTVSWGSKPFLKQPCRKRQSPHGYLETGNRRPHKRIFLGVRNTFVYLKLPT